jgi:hypothetical protein
MAGFRKRASPAKAFKQASPFGASQGTYAPMGVEGIFPFCAMVQIAAADTYADYVICRGFDISIGKFIDYEAGSATKLGMSVAKPYGKRRAGAYRIGQVYPACLPTQFSGPPFKQCPPSPTAVDWRVGQNPGVAETTQGHPADLDETIEELVDHNELYVNWMLLDASGDELVWCMLKENHPGRGICFNVVVGTWCPYEAKYRFPDCDSTAEEIPAIDWHYAVPYPDKYAQGWFKMMPLSGNESHSMIAVCVSLDCESDDLCEGTHDLDEDGECPTSEGDPCNP